MQFVVVLVFKFHLAHGQIRISVFFGLWLLVSFMLFLV